MKLQKHKAILVLTIIIAAISLCWVIPTHATQCGGVETSIIECSDTGAGSIRELLRLVINITTAGISILAVIGITIMGIQYLTAGGNEQQATKAKRRLYEIIIGLAVYVLLFGIAQWLLPNLNLDTIAVTGVTLNDSSIQVGHTLKLSPTLEPIDASNTSFSWESSNTSVATIDSNGIVTAKQTGTTTIKVTTANGKSDTATITVTSSPSGGGGSGSGGGGGSSGEGSGDDGGGPSTPTTADRYRLGSALAALHAPSKNVINTIQEAVNKKYWGIECDIWYYNNEFVCQHDQPNSSNGLVKFSDVASITKAGGTKIIIHTRMGSQEDLRKLANYLKDNDLQQWVVIQISKYFEEHLSITETMNSAVNGKLEYWGLAPSKNELNYFIGNSRSFRDRGMTTINIPNTWGSWTPSDGDIKNTQNAGYGTCIFGSLSLDRINYYSHVLGARYLMVNNLQ